MAIYEAEVRMHTPRALPVQWGLWKVYFCVPAPSNVGLFSRTIQNSEGLKQSVPDAVVHCDGVEPIVEDIRIVTLRKSGQILAWLRFVDVTARNTFMLAARPVIRSPDICAIPWARICSKANSCFLDDVFEGLSSPKFAKRSKDISMIAFLSKNIVGFHDTKAETNESTVEFEPGCCGISCASDGCIYYVAKGSQASFAGIEVGMKIVRINGKPFQTTLEMGLFGGSKNWVDGEEAYQEENYQLTFEKTALPEGASPLKASGSVKSSTTPMVGAFTDGLAKLRRIRQAVDGWMVKGAMPEKACSCKDKDFYSGQSRSSYSNTYASTMSAMLSRSISGASIWTPLEESFGLSRESCALSAVASHNFVLSDSHIGRASFCAMTDFNSFALPSTQSICEMYDDLDFSEADLCAMYDGLDVSEP